MSDEIQVEPAALRTGATQIETTAGAVDLSVDAATSMNLGGGAFGIMCAFLVPSAQLITNAAVGTMRQTADMLRREAAALRSIASDFESGETDTSSTLSGLDATLDGVR